MLGVYGVGRTSTSCLPLRRSGLTLRVMNMNENVMNRSHVIRDLFHEHGDVSGAVILDILAQQGVRCSLSLIESIRKEMKRRKVMPNKK